MGHCAWNSRQRQWGLSGRGVDGIDPDGMGVEGLWGLSGHGINLIL